MAQRRMFSLKIIDTDKFLDMPVSARELYFQLSMRADDDGFIGNPKRIIKMVGATDDDMKVLLGKQFLIPFDSGVCVISDWKIHNYIQNDRYVETQYKEEKRQLKEDENGAWIQNVYNLDTQDRLGKDRLGKDRLDKKDYVGKTDKCVSKKNIKEDFERFWKEYPKKIAKPMALKAFIKINPDEELLREMLSKLSIYKETEQWQKDKGRFIPHPATWLNQERWQDVLDDNEEIIVPEYAKKWQIKK